MEKEALKRKASAPKNESSKKIKLDGTGAVKFIAEDHAHFYPAGPIINLFALTFRTNGFTSVEVFGIDPLIRLILDYLGKYNTWAILYVDHSRLESRCCFYESGVLSIHQMEVVALRNIVTAWCAENLMSMFSEIDDDDHERQDVVRPNEEKQLKNFVRELRVDLKQQAEGLKEGKKWDDRVRSVLLSKFDESQTSEDNLRNIWKWCMKWQEMAQEEDVSGGQASGRYFTLTEMPFSS